MPARSRASIKLSTVQPFRTIEAPFALRPLFRTSENGVRGHVQACVLAYGLVRISNYHRGEIGLDPNAEEALRDLARIKRAPHNRASITAAKISTANEQHQRLLIVIGAPLPERHTASWCKHKRRRS